MSPMTTRDEPRTSHRPSSDDPVLADLVADLANRLAAGEPVDLEDYVARHPDRAEQLRQIWPAVRMMADLGAIGGRGRAEPGRTADVGAGFETLGDYRLLREVGRGGMGVVYEAEQISLGRRVALKVLPFAAAIDAKQQRRFQLEAQAAACLHHTNIVPVHAVGCERGVPFYVMQFIEGRSLAQVIAELRRARRARSGGGPLAGPRRRADRDRWRPDSRPVSASRRARRRHARTSRRPSPARARQSPWRHPLRRRRRLRLPRRLASGRAAPELIDPRPGLHPRRGPPGPAGGRGAGPRPLPRHPPPRHQARQPAARRRGAPLGRPTSAWPRSRETTA